MRPAVSTPSKNGRLTGAVSLVANLAVLVSLVLVVLELRQNRQSLDATAQISIASALQEVSSRQIENGDLAEIIVSVFGGVPDSTSIWGVEGLSPVDGTRFMAWISEWTTVLYAAYELKNAGVITETTWEIHADAFALFISFAWVREIWLDTVGTHPAAFRDDLLGRAGAPRDFGAAPEGDG